MIRILIADDHRIMRQGLRSLLEKQPNMEVVAEAENGRGAVQLVRQLSPGVVLMDVAMPDLNGIEATKQILQEAPEVRVIALSMHKDRTFVSRMLQAGAKGYLLKDTAFEEIARAVNEVMAGRIFLDPPIAEMVIEDYARKMKRFDAEEANLLTPREREVLQLIAEGRTTKQIAGRLNVSVKTIETHRRQIMDKLNLHSIAELTKYAVRKGITSPE
jgi:DNA-binding NarL/FixJ family response regulator